MRRVSAIVLGLVLAGPAFAQSPGQVWTYKGPSLGAGWANATGGTATPAGSPGDIQTNLDGTSMGAFTPGTNVVQWLRTPTTANLFAALDSKTGTGAAVFGTSPTLGSATFGTAATFNFITGSTQCLHVNSSGALSGSGSDCGGSGSTPAGVNGDIQINNSGAFGALTPAAGIATWIATPSSANLLAALSTKTGTGLAVFGTAPTVTSPTIGTAATLSFITGSTQCLHVNTSGVLSGTGSDCGAGAGSWNLTDGTHALTGVTALTVDPTILVVGGTAGAATLNSLCPAADTTLGDSNANISATAGTARITATLTASRSYTMPPTLSYPAGCTLTVVDVARTVSGTNTASLLRNATGTINQNTTFPAITAGGFWATFVSDGATNGNWAQVSSGVVPTLQAGQIYYGNASNQIAAGAPTGDVKPDSSNNWTIQASANVVTAASNIASNALAKGNGTKGVSASTVVDAGAGVTVGSPTGGAEGVGTLNATNLYVNGVAVGTSSPVFQYFITGTPGTSSTKFVQIGANVFGTNEDSNEITTARTFQKITVNVHTDPGNTQTMQFMVRKNGADTGLTCTITGNGSTNKRCTATVDAAFSIGDLFDVESIIGTGSSFTTITLEAR